jgi:hypothetical protein
VPVLARVFENHEAEMVRAAGGIPVLNSEAAAETFLSWVSAREEGGGEKLKAES